MNKLLKPLSIVGFLLSMMLVSRYLFLLMSGDSQGFSQTRNHGLWLAFGAVVIACIAGGQMFYLFLRHSDGTSTTASVPFGHAISSGRDALTVKSTTPQPFDIKRWEKLNPWLIEGQADDRMPMLGAADHGNGSLSARRSTARRTHQMMYKKWSQSRHD